MPGAVRRGMPDRISLACVTSLALVPTLGCAAPTRVVSLTSTEVTAATLSVALADIDEEGPGMRVHLAFAEPLVGDDACPTLDEAARMVLRDAEGETELVLESRGGGFVGIDCALKCHELVALESMCTGAWASLRGPAVSRLLAGGDAELVLVEGETSLVMQVGGDEVARRGVQFVDGRTIPVATEFEGPGYVERGRASVVWSHADDGARAAFEWTSGELFQDGRPTDFLLDADDDSVLIVRADGSRLGTRPVYFSSMAARAPGARCDFGDCRPIRHAIRDEVTLVAR